MSMTPEQENQLCRLLKLKRYEQPPPGYFDRFSRQVMTRITAGEANPRASWMERLLHETPWLQRVLDAFEAKPALAGAYGALVCALLMLGVVFSGWVEPAPALVAKPPQPQAGDSSLFALDAPAPQPALVSSTNPVMPPAGNLFDDRFPQPQAQPASFGPNP